MSKYFSISLLCFGVIPFLGSMEPDLDLDQNDLEERVIVGTSPMTHKEKVAIQEERAKRAAEQETNRLEEYGFAAEEEGSYYEEAALTEEHSEEKVINGAYQHIHSSHAGAFHKPRNISLTGHTVELEDGSIWSVKSCDQHKVLNWDKEHTIVIVPNHYWFSIFDYRLLNQTKGVSVASNLSFGPIVKGQHSHWIVGIDADKRTIILEDGSVWNASNFDYEIIKNWAVKETVIIGVNNRWFSGNKKNILINVHKLNYASCKCLN